MLRVFAKLIDLEAMAKEIETIRNKYGIRKFMAFIPDKMEIILERKEVNKFDLNYSEFFNYLPPHALNMAIEGTIQFLRMIWFST